MRTSADEIEPGADRDQRVGGAYTRCPIAHVDDRIGCLRQPSLVGFVSRDERAGGATHQNPPFDVFLFRMERARPDRLLINKNISRHPDKRMENSSLVVEVAILDYRTARLDVEDRVTVVLPLHG